MLEIRPATTSDDIAAVRRLFRAYAPEVGSTLCFQGFDAEMAGLPGAYASPAGRLLVAWQGTDAIGCVALRALRADACEMKRLFVHASARGNGLGRRLAERVCDEARDAGYARMFLDTLPSMIAARQLYEMLGFVTTGPYSPDPTPDAIYMMRDLTK